MGRSDTTGRRSRAFDEDWTEMRVTVFSLQCLICCTSSGLSLGSQAGCGANISLWIWKSHPQERSRVNSSHRRVVVMVNSSPLAASVP